MATYIIGDVQGCYHELQRLLEKINFDPASDRLGFVGDLVNRGPHSLEVIRLVKSLRDPIVVLGNHDLYLLALGFECVQYHGKHSLDATLQAPDKEDLLHWLRKQPLIYFDKKQNYLVVHAGIPPQWSVATALERAQEVEYILRGNNFKQLLENMLGIKPEKWEEDLIGWNRLRYIINAFTRMRFCDQQGELDLFSKETATPKPELYKPWFELMNPEGVDILFGHWAALEGKAHRPHIYALDTGCVWGNALTALRIEDKRYFSVPAFNNSTKL